jgi:hypothetical protein
MVFWTQLTAGSLKKLLLLQPFKFREQAMMSGLETPEVISTRTATEILQSATKIIGHSLSPKWELEIYQLF